MSKEEVIRLFNLHKAYCLVCNDVLDNQQLELNGLDRNVLLNWLEDMTNQTLVDYCSASFEYWEVQV